MKLTNNLTFKSILASYEAFYNCEYSDTQKKQLEFGYEDGIDISKYANPEFNYLQMNFIRNGLVKNLEVDKYAFVQYNQYLMEMIYHLLSADEQFDKYVDGDYLDLAKLGYAYELSCRQKNLVPINEFGKNYVLDHSPYHVYYKGDT